MYVRIRAVGAKVVAHACELAGANVARLLRGSRLVIDTFDNSPSRRTVAEWCASACVPCLHAGLSGGYGEVMWNDGYRIPSPAQDDICDYPLARNLVMMVASVACESAIRFIGSGPQSGHMLTLEDFAIRLFGA